MIRPSAPPITSCMPKPNMYGSLAAACNSHASRAAASAGSDSRRSRIRAARSRAADSRRAAAARAAAARRESAARERAARMRDRRLSEPALAAAREACELQAAASEPYMFGFGMQDVIGGAEGLIIARAALARRLERSARDAYDRRKLRPLVRAVAAGNRALARLAAAEAAGD